MSAAGAVCDTRELQLCVSNTDMNKGPTTSLAQARQVRAAGD